MKSSKSVILFWNYEDMHAIDPLLVLSSPLEIMTFEFNPKDPSIIIAGAINGQIMMWDLKGLEIGTSSKKKVKKTQTGSTKEILPVITSVLQDPASVQQVSDTVKRNVASHKAPIVCIRWFPSGLELDMKKNISTLIPPASSEINQFASISTDGQVLLWEKKFLDAQKKPVTDVQYLLNLVISVFMEGRIRISLVQAWRRRSNGRFFNGVQEEWEKTSFYGNIRSRRTFCLWLGSSFSRRSWE